MLDRYPAPAVEVARTEPSRSEPIDTLTQYSTPTGLWLRVGGSGLSPENQAQTSHGVRGMRPRAGDARFFLLLGAPQEELPTAAAVADVVRTLDNETRARMVVTVYGAEPDGEPSLAFQLANALGVPIRSHHGLFVTDVDGLAHVTAIDSADRPTWQPFTELTTYLPGTAEVTVNRWHAPFREAVSLGAATYRLTEDWLVEVIPAGLLARPRSRRPDPLLRVAPTHPDRVDLLVDGPDGTPLPDDMLTAIGRFADSLPAPARSRLRLMPTAAVAEASGRRLRWAVPAPAALWSPPRTVVRATEDVPPVPVPPVVDEAPPEVVDDAEPSVAELDGVGLPEGELDAVVPPPTVDVGPTVEEPDAVVPPSAVDVVAELDEYPPARFAAVLVVSSDGSLRLW